MPNKRENNVNTSMPTIDATFFGDVVEANGGNILSYKYQYGDKTIEVVARKSLSYTDKAAFVKSVWDIFYSIDGNGMRDYRPYMINLTERYLTVQYYCLNIPLSTDVDIGTYEAFLIDTDFYDCLLEHINVKDYQFLLHCVDSYIDCMIKLHSAVVRSNADIAIDELISRILEVAEKIKEDEIDTDSVANFIKNEFIDGEDDETQRESS